MMLAEQNTPIVQANAQLEGGKKQLHCFLAHCMRQKVTTSSDASLLLLLLSILTLVRASAG